MRKYYIVTILTLSVALLTVSSALAFGEIRFPDRPLNLRKSRSAKAEWVGSLYPGQMVRVAFLKDGWVAVFEPGESNASEDAAVGYSNVKFLKAEQTRVEPKAWGTLMKTTQKLNVRSQPSTRGAKVTLLDIGETVKIDFPDDEWVMVFAPDATIRSQMNGIGYASSEYMKPAGSTGVTTPGPAKSENRTRVKVTPPREIEKTVSSKEEKGVSQPDETPSGIWGKVVTVQRKVNIREQRTTGARYVRTVQPGERVRVDFLKNGWYAVFAENEPLRMEKRAMGYALQSLLESGSESNRHEGSPRGSSAKVETRKAVAGESVAATRKSMVIDRTRFSGAKRPDPIADKTIHGYQYRLLEKSEARRYGESWITLKVFLSSSTLPSSAGLTDFATTLWKEHRRATKNLAVFIYLPGMDTDDLAYGVVQFSDEKMLEKWVRKTTLLGTKFL